MHDRAESKKLISDKFHLFFQDVTPVVFDAKCTGVEIYKCYMQHTSARYNTYQA
jgi:hypothetical protein